MDPNAHAPPFAQVAVTDTILQLGGVSRNVEGFKGPFIGLAARRESKGPKHRVSMSYVSLSGTGNRGAANTPTAPAAEDRWGAPPPQATNPNASPRPSTAPVSAAAPAGGEDDGLVRFCGKCGTDRGGPDAVFCMQCGLKF